MSWRIEAEMLYGEVYRNRFRFATPEEAKAYGERHAWNAVGFDLLQSDDPVTHKYVNGRLENAVQE